MTFTFHYKVRTFSLSMLHKTGKNVNFQSEKLKYFIFNRPFCIVLYTNNYYSALLLLFKTLTALQVSMPLTADSNAAHRTLFPVHGTTCFTYMKQCVSCIQNNLFHVHETGCIVPGLPFMPGRPVMPARRKRMKSLRTDVVVYRGETAVRLERHDVGALSVVFVQASHDDAR